MNIFEIHMDEVNTTTDEKRKQFLNDLSEFYKNGQE